MFSLRSLSLFFSFPFQIDPKVAFPRRAQPKVSVSPPPRGVNGDGGEGPMGTGGRGQGVGWLDDVIGVTPHHTGAR